MTFIHFVLPADARFNKRALGAHRPAVIVTNLKGRATVSVFIDPDRDSVADVKGIAGGLPPLLTFFDVAQDEKTRAPGTWHTIEMPEIAPEPVTPA